MFYNIDCFYLMVKMDNFKEYSISKSDNFFDEW